MPTPSHPADIARETLKLLAERRLAPTPENYLQLYNEISGIASTQVVDLEQILQKTLHDAATESPALRRSFAGVERALAEHDWKGIELGLAALFHKKRGDKKDTSWADLIRDLLKEWETKRSGLTAHRKKEALEHILARFSSDPEVLQEKLHALVHRWMAEPISQGVDTGGPPDTGAEQPQAPLVAAPVAATLPVKGVTDSLPELVAQVLEIGVAGRLTQFPDLLAETRKLAQMAREVGDVAAIGKLAKELRKFWIQLELRGEDDAKLLDGLYRLLRLLVDNIGELMLDGDQWLRGQVAVVQEIISHPLNTHALFDAERGLKEVIFKQGNLKHGLNEAKATLKSMIATFVDRLGDMSDSTGDFHSKIENYTEKLSKTEDISQLNSILGDILRDTKSMQLDIKRTRDELMQARKEVETAENKVRQLEAELEQISDRVREDQLTGALNRHGMEEAFHRELAHAERTGAPLCVAMLDIDNFKRLNDTYGHLAGDAALVHLTNVIKEIVRPTDVVVRYGGEEFLVILPETLLDDGVHIVSRLQRELTKRFFLHQNERLLITFSAGVALRGAGESSDSMISRADAALYKAKLAGKNRVFPAE